MCRKILEVEVNLWTFAEVEGVAPDNNAAERSLRHGVIWRKPSLGTASEAGSRFVERLLSVVETCRQGERGSRSHPRSLDRMVTRLCLQGQAVNGCPKGSRKFNPPT